MTKSQKITYYTLLVIVSLVFVASALSKLFSNPQAVAGFAVAHLPAWFMYFIGICEILGAIGIWIPKFQAAAAYCLMVILAGAIVVTAVFVSVPEALFPLIVGVMLSFIVKLGKKKKQAMKIGTIMADSKNSTI